MKRSKTSNSYKIYRIPHFLSKYQDEKLDEKLKELKHLLGLSVIEDLRQHLQLKIEQQRSEEDRTTPESAFKCAWHLANIRGRRQELTELLNLFNQ